MHTNIRLRSMLRLFRIYSEGGYIHGRIQRGGGRDPGLRLGTIRKPGSRLTTMQARSSKRSAKPDTKDPHLIF